MSKKYVYCTDCLYGEGLIKALEMNEKIPNKCKGCNPYNPKDGVACIERPNYVEFCKRRER